MKTLDPATRYAVAATKVPTLFFAGTDDPVHEAVREDAATCPNGQFTSLVGLNYPDSFFRIDLVLPLVTEFLAEHA